MKARILSVTVVVGLVYCIGVAAAQVRQQPTGQNPQQQTQAPKATIEGSVTRAGSGQPLKGARVTLIRANATQNPLGRGIATGATDIQGRLGALTTALSGAAVSVTTDGNGRFTVTGLDPGQYRVSADRAGFIHAEYGQRTPTGRGIDVSAVSNQTVTITLPMQAASVISGRVLTPDGEAAANNSVQVYTYQYTNGQRTLAQVANTRTNDLGEYRLFWLQPGEYFVSVTNDAAIDSDASLGVADAANRGGNTGGGQGQLRAVLTSALGNGGGQALQLLGGGVTPPVYYPGTIDTEGATPVTVAASTEVRGIDFNLRPVRAATVSGRVVAPFPLGAQAGGGRGNRGGDAGGLAQVLQIGVAPVQLSLSRVGSARQGLGGLAGLGLGGTPVNPDGSFEIKSVAPGEYNLTATANDASNNNQEYTARTRITVGTSDIKNVVVAVRPGMEVRGKITVESAPPQQFKMTSLRVTLVAEEGGLAGIANLIVGAGQGRRGQAGGAQGNAGTVAEDGTFTLQNVGAMEYRVRVTGLPQGAFVQSGRIGSIDALNAPFTVDNQGTVIDLKLGFSAGRVTGMIADQKGDAVPGVQAILVPDEARRGRTDAYFTANADANGQFIINNVPPGSYKLFSWENIPAGAYQYADFLRRYEDRGVGVTVNPNGAVTANARLIPSS